MACSCAEQTDDYNGWKCNVTDSPCVYLVPNSKKCAFEWGEGPDVKD